MVTNGEYTLKVEQNAGRRFVSAHLFFDCEHDQNNYRVDLSHVEWPIYNIFEFKLNSQTNNGSGDLHVKLYFEFGKDAPETVNNGSSWMSQNAGVLKDKKLRHITLPATHDSGSYPLEPEQGFAFDSGAMAIRDKFKDILNALQDSHQLDLAKLRDEIAKLDPSNAADLGDWFKNLGKFVVDSAEAAWHTLREKVYEFATAISKSFLEHPNNPGLGNMICQGVVKASEAQGRTIAKQLEDGIRCLDLRICKDNDGKYRTCHGLFGPLLDQILKDINAFLDAHPGELLCITVGHFAGPPDGNGYKATEIHQQIVDHLGPHIYPPPKGTDTNLFDTTYGTITDEGKVAKCILISEGAADEHFWSVDYNSVSYPGDGGDKLYGGYSNTDDPMKMYASQASKMMKAKDMSAPFALWLTLTEDISGITGIIVKNIIGQILDEIQSMDETVVTGLLAYILNRVGARWQSGYDSLQDLSGRVDPTARMGLVNGPLQPSLIYVDFYEATRVVDHALALNGCHG